MKVRDMDLGELVQTIRNAGYEERYSMNVNGRLWRMYAKEENGVLRAAYVSDIYGLLSTETFAKLHHDSEEEAAVREILSRYESSLRRIDEIGKDDFDKVTLASILGCAAIGFGAMRHPIGAVFGGAVGYFVSEAVNKVRISAERSKLAAYLREHKIKVGDDALSQLLSEYSPVKETK